MDRWWLVAVIVTLQTISTSKSSMVNLTNGGYDDIVIAIHPGIPESAELIQKVKDMVNEATHYLFNATQKKLFIRSAKILIPFTWSKQNYTKRRTETYDKPGKYCNCDHWITAAKLWLLQFPPKLKLRTEVLSFSLNFTSKWRALFGQHGRLAALTNEKNDPTLLSGTRIDRLAEQFQIFK